MKTIIATKKPPFNEWAKFIYKEVKEAYHLRQKTGKEIDLRQQNVLLDK